MPGGTVDLLFGFLRQNTGVLSKWEQGEGLCREVAKIEVSYSGAFPQ